jgi:DNA replication protein DnaC
MNSGDDMIDDDESSEEEHEEGDDLAEGLKPQRDNPDYWPPIARSSRDGSEEPKSFGELLGPAWMAHLEKMRAESAARRAGGCERMRDGVRCAKALPPEKDISRETGSDGWLRRRPPIQSPIEKALYEPTCFDSFLPDCDREGWWGLYLCTECEADAIVDIDHKRRMMLSRHLDKIDRDLLPRAFRHIKPKAPETQQIIPLRARQEAAKVLPVMLKNDPEVATLTLVGPSGTGKSSLAVLLVRHIFALALEAPIRSDIVRIACGIVWVDAIELSPDGNDPHMGCEDYYRRAVDAPLVVIDDLGAEGHGGFKDLASKLIHKRFHRRGRPSLPTIVTTGLDEEQIANKYSGGIGRRILTDDGGLVRVVRFEAKAKTRAA